MKKSILIIVAILSFVASGSRAIPPMPDLDRAIAAGEIITEQDLENRAGDLEARLVLEAAMRIFGLTEDQARSEYAGLVAVVRRIAGAEYDKDDRDLFYEEYSETDADAYSRHLYISKQLSTDPLNTELLEKMRLGVLEMEAKEYSRLRTAGAAFDYRNKLVAALPKGASKDEANLFMFKRIARAAAIPDLGTEGRSYVWRKYLDEFFDSKNVERRTVLFDLVEATPGVDSWILEMMHGTIERRVAWAARGGAYAYKTSDEKMDGFHQHLDQAMIHFQAAYAIDPMCPSTSQQMVNCLYPRGSTWDAQGWAWFERTLIACIDYEYVFDTIETALNPKWHGDIESRSEFVIWCNNPSLYHTPFPYKALFMLDDIMWHYGVKYKDNDAFWEDENEAIQATIQALGGMLANRKDDFYRDYTHTVLAYLYYRSESDLDIASAHIRACKKGVSRNAQRLMGCDDFNLESAILPLAAETQETSLEAIVAESNQLYDEAIELWSQVLGVFESNDDELGSQAVRDTIQRIKWKAQYAKYQWVELGFDEYMSGWDDHEGTWERVDQRTTQGSQRGSLDQTLLIADISTGDQYEYTVDVQFDRNAKLDSMKNALVGLFFYRGQRETDLWDQMRTASVALYDGVGGMGWHYSIKYFSEPIEMTKDNKYTVRVVIQGDQVQGFVNGVLIGKGKVPNYKPEKEPARNRVGIGSFNFGTTNAVFTNIRIRRKRVEVELEF